MSHEVFGAGGATVNKGVPTQLIFGEDLGADYEQLTVGAGNTPQLYGIKVDATANPKEAVTVRIYDATSPTVGTTGADIAIYCPAGKIQTWVSAIGLKMVAIAVACVREEGGTGGNTNPSGRVDVTLWIDPGPES